MAEENSIKRVIEIMNAVKYDTKGPMRIYHVKNYQRGYRWGLDQIKNLLDDIYKNFKKYWRDLEKADKPRLSGFEYCIQPLVLRNITDENDKSDNTEKYSVIDGQQRLTTLSLVFRALDLLDANRNNPYMENTKDLIHVTYERNDNRNDNRTDNRTDNKSILDSLSDWFSDYFSEKVKESTATAAVSLFSWEKWNTTLSECLQIKEIKEKILDKDNKKINWNKLPQEFEGNEGIQKWINDINKDAVKTICNNPADNPADNPAFNIIDIQFMINAYVYLLVFFEIILEEETSENSYFAFMDKESDPKQDYRESRLEELRTILKYYTTIIWYEPLKEGNSERREEEIFENFNSRKIPLTKSELVKAMFMNPDNYIVEGKNDYNNEAIKIRQIMLGNTWDSVEQELHNEELWHFFPHYNEWHNQTRFDAIIDYFVFCELKNRESGDTNKTSKTSIQSRFQDKLFAFKQLEAWLKEELSLCESSAKKAEKMKEWWDKIYSVYTRFSELFHIQNNVYDIKTKGKDNSLKIFHRISLLQWMYGWHFSNITNGSTLEKYFNQLEKNQQLFEEMNKVLNTQKIETLNKLIVKEINELFKNKLIKVYETGEFRVEKEKCNDLENMIKALIYDRNNFLIDVFLIIFSLQILESAEGMTSRFSFYLYSQKDSSQEEDWIKEHIFAVGTNLEKYKDEKSEKQKIFLTFMKDCKWEEYINYRFNGLLDDEQINKIVERKKALLKLIDPIIESIESNETYNSEIWDQSGNSYAADTIIPTKENDHDGLIIEFFKDNSMGNMALLTRADNTSVGNKLYSDKKNKIIERINKGQFVPSATTNVFNGTYCDDKFSTEIWYPCHRIEYLRSMVEAVTKYLN